MLSVRLVNGADACCWVPVDPDLVQWDEVPGLDMNHVVRLSVGGTVWMPDGMPLMQLKSEVVPLLPGVWDLPMVGPECLELERAFQRLTGGAEYTRGTFDGVLVTRPTEAKLYQIQEHHSDPLGFFPAGSFPEDSEFVVRTDALTALQVRLSNVEQSKQPAAAY